MQQDIFIDYDVDAISYDNFVNQELIQFSHADNERSIPHFMDGLKPSQRKGTHSLAGLLTHSLAYSLTALLTHCLT